MGKQVSFRAPCAGTAAEAIQIEGVNYTICDALGRSIAGDRGVWQSGEIISVILDTENQKALIQNAATLKRDEQLSTATASLFGLGSDAVPDDVLRDIGERKPVTYTVSVPTGWSANSAGGYYKTVTVTGMRETDDPIADVLLGADVAANALYLRAWGNVSRIVTSENAVTLYANTVVPSSAFSMRLKVVR